MPTWVNTQKCVNKLSHDVANIGLMKHFDCKATGILQATMTQMHSDCCLYRFSCCCTDRFADYWIVIGNFFVSTVRVGIASHIDKC